MTYERLDREFLTILEAAPGGITLAQLRERRGDAFAAPLTEEWAREAAERGLVAARAQADLPLRWTLTGKGRRRARRAAG